MVKATFGAGCFWGVQSEFDSIEGVSASKVGYSGGHKPNPSYEEVCTGTTGHAEVLEIEFDPKKVSFESLLEVFWNLHDPTQLNRQGPDVGEQYRSVIFYHSDEQKKIAENSMKALKESGRYNRPIVTQILPARDFYLAEEYHQKYNEKNGATCS